MPDEVVRDPATLLGNPRTALGMEIDGAGSEADPVAAYVERLTDEVHMYTVTEPNYGQAARRIYTIFRLTGRDEEAAYIRGLVDESGTALCQVVALLRALDGSVDTEDAGDTDAMVAQLDQLILSGEGALDGPSESEMARRLLRLRDVLSRSAGQAGTAEEISDVRADAMAAVNAYFQRMLTAVPSIAAYIDSVSMAQRTSQP